MCLTGGVGGSIAGGTTTKVIATKHKRIEKYLFHLYHMAMSRRERGSPSGSK